MMRDGKTLVYFLFCFFLCFCTSASDASVSTTLMKEGFSISIPHDWEEIPKQILDETFEFIKEHFPDTLVVRSDYGFSRKDSEHWFDYPHIFVQIKNMGRISEREFRGIAGTDSSFEVDDINKSFIEFFKKDKIGKNSAKTFYDEKHKIIWMIVTDHVYGVGQIASLSGIFHTENGFIHVLGYCLLQDYGKYEDLFKSVVLSVEPKLPYKTSSSGYTSSLKENIIIRILSKGFSVALVYCVFLGVRKVFRKKE